MVIEDFSKLHASNLLNNNNKHQKTYIYSIFPIIESEVSV